jgi:hypothetical protein
MEMLLLILLFIVATFCAVFMVCTIWVLFIIKTLLMKFIKWLD